MLAFSEYIPSAEKVAFEQKVIQISNALGINPNWLMILMYSESGLNPKASNPIPPYPVGLIQFAQQTAIGLGTSTQALLSMSRLQQLDYVYKYFAPKRGKFKSIYDLYLYNFLPSSVGYNDFHIIGSEISPQYAVSVAQSNKGFDLNNNNQITIAEFKQFIKKKYGKYIGKTDKNKTWLLALVLLFVFEEEIGIDLSF
jgi:hypothetical protein